MSFRRLILSDAGPSLAFHLLKALVALALNWLVLHHFPVKDFVTWSVTSSILIVATASDLGIGQYTTTRLINSSPDDWREHIGRGLTALIPLALVAFTFVLVVLSGPSLFYRAAMALLLAERIVTIPFVAVLHATNRFKIRKAIELGAYVGAALLVGGTAIIGADIHAALLALNAAFFVGQVLMAAAALGYLPANGRIRLTAPSRSLDTLRMAVPFMVNNVTGLLTYGGFIWLSSFALTQSDVATLAVLHSFFLINAYQIYDVVLKARQADLADPDRLPLFRMLNILLMVALPPAFLIAGPKAAALIDHRILLDPVDAALFGLFMTFELGNLFAQSIAQVNLTLAKRLNAYSMIKSGTLVSFALASSAPVAEIWRLPLLLALLSSGSAIAYLYLIRQIRREALAGGAMMPASFKVEGQG